MPLGLKKEHPRALISHPLGSVASRPRLGYDGWIHNRFLQRAELTLDVPLT